MSEGKVKRKIIFLIFAAVMVVAGGCGTDGGDTEASRDLFAMDTYMTVTAYGKGATEAVDQAADEISRLDISKSSVRKTYAHNQGKSTCNNLTC